MTARTVWLTCVVLVASATVPRAQHSTSSPRRPRPRPARAASSASISIATAGWTWRRRTPAATPWRFCSIAVRPGGFLAPYQIAVSTGPFDIAAGHLDSRRRSRSSGDGAGRPGDRYPADGLGWHARLAPGPGGFGVARRGAGRRHPRRHPRPRVLRLCPQRPRRPRPGDGAGVCASRGDRWRQCPSAGRRGRRLRSRRPDGRGRRVHRQCHARRALRRRIGRVHAQDGRGRPRAQRADRRRSQCRWVGRARRRRDVDQRGIGLSWRCRGLRPRRDAGDRHLTARHCLGRHQPGRPSGSRDGELCGQLADRAARAP